MLSSNAVSGPCGTRTPDFYYPRWADGCDISDGDALDTAEEHSNSPCTWPFQFFMRLGAAKRCRVICLPISL